jgi:uncharacterized protein GlcG (DUF336 family)
MGLTLKTADAIIEGALAEAARSGMKPLAVVVLDAGGHMVAMKRQDRATFLRPDIARAKAWTALGLEAPSRALGEIAGQRPHFVASLFAISEGRMAPAAGGALVRQGETILGAVGVSGDTPDNDEKAALAGIAAAGF